MNVVARAVEYNGAIEAGLGTLKTCLYHTRLAERLGERGANTESRPKRAGYELQVERVKRNDE